MYILSDFYLEMEEDDTHVHGSRKWYRGSQENFFLRMRKKNIEKKKRTSSSNLLK